MAAQMSKYRVRDHFTLHPIDGEPVEAGTVVELTDEEAEFYAAQIEPVLKPQRTKSDATG
jgi:hypothetical protein